MPQPLALLRPIVQLFGHFQRIHPHLKFYRISPRSCLIVDADRPRAYVASHARFFIRFAQSGFPGQFPWIDLAFGEYPPLVAARGDYKERPFSLDPSVRNRSSLSCIWEISVQRARRKPSKDGRQKS